MIATIFLQDRRFLKKFNEISIFKFEVFTFISKFSQINTCYAYNNEFNHKF